ncbi:MAG: radical SAM family heme chaperone HemW [Oscillospiraceae bacterium]|jgi:oxygen-independent coproporphyrinogen-3 oxidase|nr:radical SAM family heme chaperone HemW [Oscillospiraceae bacterium]
MDKFLGIYIHLPFCSGKCAYCDFYSVDGDKNLMDRYLEALERHITESAAQMEPYYIDTVYFGGGTPSLFGAERLCRVFNALKNNAKVLKSAEVTVEMNPDDVRASELQLLKSEGVNRISLGMQSANDEILHIIGRRHNFEQVKQAVSLIRAEGFENLSLDLIYGLPTQTREDWADTLTKAALLRPEHLSCYGLKLEEGSRLLEFREQGLLPSDDDQADMYLYMTDMLLGFGFGQYEISNFARRGFKSRHNIKYWRLGDYMGFGPAAHSCIENVRYSFVRDVEDYIEGVESGESLLDEYERLSRLDAASEYLMLGMRTVAGVSRKEYAALYRSGFDKIEYLFEEYEKKGWAKRYKDRWRFTSSGFLLSNILIGTLLEAQSQEKMYANPWITDTIDTAGRTE